MAEQIIPYCPDITEHKCALALALAHATLLRVTTYLAHLVLEYWEFCDRMIDDAVDALDLDGTESGFSWEHQFVNIRHIQHHAAQLIDRVRSAANVGIR